MLWILYALCILLLWYENRWIACSWPTDRPLWFSPRNQGLLWLVRVVITYATLAGVWYQFGFGPALIAFAAYYVFGKISFRIYFDREVRQWATRFADFERKEAERKREAFNEAEMWEKCFQRARWTVTRNMKGGSL